MAGICDGANCLGLSTDLNGSTCLTNPVQCKDGILTVPSQGTVLRRYASEHAAGSLGTGNDDQPYLVPPNTVATITGPRLPSGNDAMTVTITNPFCAVANVLINFEYSANLGAANTDDYAVSGEVSITGGTFVEDNVSPFNTNNPLVAGPSVYANIRAYGQANVGVADSGELFIYTHSGSFTVMAQLPSLGTATFVGHARVDLNARGGFRAIRGFNCATTFSITPAL